MKATLVRGVNTSPYSVKNVDRNSMMNVGVTREPEKEFDIDAALELLRNKIRQIKKFFPNVDTTNLEESLDLTERIYASATPTSERANRPSRPVSETLRSLCAPSP
jgi:hypothetical protein